jgi:hypothetical protein
VGASTSHNPVGLHGLLQGELYLFIYCMSRVGSGSMLKSCEDFGMEFFYTVQKIACRPNKIYVAICFAFRLMIIINEARGTKRVIFKLYKILMLSSVVH